MKPVGSIKEAWEAAKLRAGKILRDDSHDKDSKEPIEPLPCGSTICDTQPSSRMLNAGVPIAKVTKIAGWSTATMVRMGSALRALHTERAEGCGGHQHVPNQTESPVISPVSEDASESARAN